MAKRNYQDIIFQNSAIQTIEYISEDLTTTPTIARRLADIYTPVGDTEDKRLCVICLHGGGGTKEGMRQWCNDITSRGGVAVSPDYGNTGDATTGGFDKEDQIDAIQNVGVLSRYLHANKSTFKISGQKIAVIGVSAGGLTAWQFNVSIPLDDPMFVSPVNNIHKKAKMGIIGSASMPGGCSDFIRRLINPDNKPHYAYAGIKDDIFKIQSVRNAITDMNNVDVESIIREFDADHSLGNHDVIIKDVMAKFAALMGIAPIVSET